MVARRRQGDRGRAEPSGLGDVAPLLEAAQYEVLEAAPEEASAARRVRERAPARCAAYFLPKAAVLEESVVAEAAGVVLRVVDLDERELSGLGVAPDPVAVGMADQHALYVGRLGEQFE